MEIPNESKRRTVLKTIGAGVVGGTVLTGTASAGDTGDNRRQDSFAWAQNDLYEMLESEPHPPNKDSEGDEEAHRPLWLIKATGKQHSPHPNPENLFIDHVVPLVDFSAQWHVHLVLDAEKPFIDHDNDPDTDKVPNFVNQVDSGPLLTSANRINNADVHIQETDIVFTCPIRPHNHK